MADLTAEQLAKLTPANLAKYKAFIAMRDKQFARVKSKGFLDKAASSAGKVVAAPIKLTAGAAKLAGSVVGKIPIIGTPLKAVVSLASAPLSLANSIAKGDRVDKAVMNNIKQQVKDVKAVGPYAQMVLSVVPGVGTIAAGAIGAGIALADGQPITKAMVTGLKGSIPGGPAGQALFSISEAAVQGKPLAEIGISALPIPDSQKKAVTATLTFARDVAAGKRVDDALIKQAEKNLPPDLRKALAVTVAIAQGQQVQKTMLAAVTPDALNKLSDIGGKIVTTNATLAAGMKIAATADAQKGFRAGIGMMQFALSPMELAAIRGKLKGEVLKGFDLAVAGKAGMVSAPAVKLATPAAQFAYAATHSVANAEPAIKANVVAKTIAVPEAKVGLVTAAKEIAVGNIAAKKKGWWHELLVKLGLTIKS
jgi:hypothetical protein